MSAPARAPRSRPLNWRLIFWLALDRRPGGAALLVAANAHLVHVALVLRSRTAYHI